MKTGMAIAIVLGVAGLAGAAFAEDIPPPPSGPYAAARQQPADIGDEDGPRAETQNPNWGPPPPPPPPAYGYPAPQQPAANANTASGQPAAPQGWAPPPPPPYGYGYGPYDDDRAYGRAYGRGYGHGRGHMRGNFSFGGGADSDADLRGRGDNQYNGYNRGDRGWWGPGWW